MLISRISRLRKWTRMPSTNDELTNLSGQDAVGNRSASVESQAIAGQNLLLTSILSASTEEMAVLDEEGRFLFVNRAAALAIGLAQEEILGKTGLEVGAPPEVVAQFDREREIVFATGAPLAGTIVYPTPPRGHVTTTISGRGSRRRKARFLPFSSPRGMSPNASVRRWPTIF